MKGSLESSSTREMISFTVKSVKQTIDFHMTNIKIISRSVFSVKIFQPILPKVLYFSRYRSCFLEEKIC